MASFLPLIALVTVDNAKADSRSLTLSTGYNETALSSDLRPSTVLQGYMARGPLLYTGSIDSRGLGSLGIGVISSNSDVDMRSNRYPVLTLFGRPGDRPGVAFDLHQEWYMRGAPTATPDKHVTMFQTQGGVMLQEGRAPKVRVEQRFVTAERRRPSRTQGVEWIWEFRRDYPAVYSPVNTHSEMTPLTRRSMRFENWIFFTREVGPTVMRLNVGATYKTVPEASGEASPTTTGVETPTGGQYRRVPILMFRVGFELRRW